MFAISPLLMILLGVLMMAGGGVIVPLLMVIHVLEANFFLIFASYAISTGGLYLGVIGVSQYVQTNRKK